MREINHVSRARASHCRARDGAGQFAATAALFAVVAGCSGGGGGGTTPAAAPVVSASISASTVTTSTPVTISWSSTNATSCSISELSATNLPASGTEQVSPATSGQFTYTVVCTGAGGTNQQVLTLNVTPPPAFAATLRLSSISVATGGRAGVVVSVSRSSDFTGDVTVTLANPPAGVSALDTTVAAGLGQASVKLEVDATIAAGSTQSLVLVASGGGLSLNLPLALTVTAPQPTSESLIATDLAAGVIDYPTSLLYRTYAIFNDPNLPAQYQGASSPKSDGLFRALSHTTLPADVAALIAPYVARPTDAASIYQQTSAASAKSSRRPVRKDTASVCATQPGELELSGWKSIAVAAAGATGLRIWVQCNGQPTAEDSMLLLAGLTAQSLLPPMTALMGQPVADLGAPFGGPDTAIDVYLVPGCVANAAEGSLPGGRTGSLCDTKESDTTIDGVTMSTSPASGGTCSDFILLNSDQLGSVAFSSTFAHEFFHAQQDAHNCTIDTEDFWFTEASATWAEAHFVPSAAASEVHTRFTSDFQPSTQALDSVAGLHSYAAYIWPYFFEQHFGASTMATAWNFLTGLSDPTTGTNELGSATVYDFKTNFRDFAVENLNKNLPPVLSAQSRYTALDQKFPGTTPSISDDELTGAGTTTANVDIQPLRGTYDRYHVASTTIKKVVFKFADLVVRDGLDIDALIKLTGHDWQRFDWNQSGEVKFCLDKPDQMLEDSYLVLSNHNLPAGTTAQGDYKVEASDIPCGQQWTGTVIADFGDHMVASVTFTLDPDQSTATKAVFTATGSVSFSAPNCSVSPGSASIAPGSAGLTIDFSTPTPTYQMTGSSTWLATYTCGSSPPTQLPAGGIWLADPSQVPPYATGTLGTDQDGNRIINGSASGSGYSYSWTFTEQ